MDQNALTLLFKAVADALAPHIVENVIDRLNTSGMLTTEIDTRIQAALDPKGLETGAIRQIVQSEMQAKIDTLGPIDKQAIIEIVKGEIEDMDIDQSISDWMDNNFDITDHEDNLDINDRISDWVDSNLTDRVRDEVRDLSFSVTVD